VPIYDLGYRGWQGRLVPEAGRFWAITTTGIRLAWQSKFLRRILLLAWAPTALFAAGFFAYEQFASRLDNQGTRQALEFLSFLVPGVDDHLLPPELRTRQFRSSRPDPRPGAQAGAPDPRIPRGGAAVGRAWRDGRSGPGEEAGDSDGGRQRHLVWSWLLSNFFRYPQAVVMALMVGIIAPPLVAQDVRTRAFMLYFSRPLTRIEYVVGKMAVLWGYLALITTLPALFLYVLGVFLSPPDVPVVWHTWDLPLRILAASAVLMIPTTALALALSSLTSEIRYATFAWFAIWAVGWVTYAIVNASMPPGARTPGQAVFVDRMTLASFYHTLGRVQHWVFGLETSLPDASAASINMTATAAIEMAAITLVSLAVLFRRVSSPMRI